jgi:hypothetical protein
VLRVQDCLACIPKNSVVKYETSIKAGKFVLVAHGTAEEVAKHATC